MSSHADEFPRPDGVAEWIGTVVGLLLGVALAAVGVAVLVAVVSAPFGLLILPAVLLAGDPWWWAWVIGAGATIGILLMVGLGLAVGHLVERREAAESEGTTFEQRGPAWRVAARLLDRRSTLGRGLWAGLLIALVVTAALSREIWPLALAVMLAATAARERSRLVYAGSLVALLAFAAASAQIWWAVVAGVLIFLDVMEIAARRVADAHRRSTARR